MKEIIYTAHRDHLSFSEQRRVRA